MYFLAVTMTGVLLFVAGIIDIKSKTISIRMIIILTILCLVGMFMRVFVKKELGLWEAAGGVLIGFCAIGLSMTGGEQIGRGDGIVIAVIGLVLGFRKCLFAVCMASIIMTLVSVFILILRMGDRKTRLPFIPALFTGYVMCMAVAG